MIHSVVGLGSFWIYFCWITASKGSHFHRVLYSTATRVFLSSSCWTTIMVVCSHFLCTAILAALLIDTTVGHGGLTFPPPRNNHNNINPANWTRQPNGDDYHSGGPCAGAECLWFSEGCFHGCPNCSLTMPAVGNYYGTPNCVNPNPTPTLPEKYRTWNINNVSKNGDCIVDSQFSTSLHRTPTCTILIPFFIPRVWFKFWCCVRWLHCAHRVQGRNTTHGVLQDTILLRIRAGLQEDILRRKVVVGKPPRAHTRGT